MPVSFTLILMILLVSAGVAFLIWLIQILIVKVNISTKRGSGAMQELMFLKFRSGNAAADVKYIASPSDEEAIGHVAVKDGFAWVEIATTADAAGNMRYKKVGYVDADGYIYEAKKGAEPKRIGYLAKPSRPNEPTITGERSWRQLWLYKTLDVYLGDPGTVVVEEKGKKNKKGDENAAQEKEERRNRKNRRKESEEVEEVKETKEAQESKDVKAEAASAEPSNISYGSIKIASAPENPGALVTSSTEPVTASDADNTVVSEEPNNNFQSVSMRHIDENDYSKVPLVDITPVAVPVKDEAAEEAEDTQPAEDTVKIPETAEPVHETVSEPVEETPAEPEAAEPVEEDVPAPAEETPAEPEASEPAPEVVPDPVEEAPAEPEAAESVEEVVPVPAEDNAPEETSENDAEEEPVAAEEPVAVPAVVEESETPAEEEQQPVPEPEPDPLDTPEERAYLNGVREKYPEILEEIKNQMIFIKGGTFRMGADAVESESGQIFENNESPVHNVSLSSYYMGMYPITQRIWSAIMGYNNSAKVSENFPVAPVNWGECDLFVRRLSKLLGHRFNLPTEAQWEFAARGGNKSRGYIFAGSDDFAEVGRNRYDCNVGTRKPNELGLYDMSGLVREWTADWFMPYTDEAQTDPKFLVMPEEPERQMRSVRSPAGNCTVTNRKGEFPTGPADKDFKSYGFRVVCEVTPEELERRESAASIVGAPVITLGGGEPVVIVTTDDVEDYPEETLRPAVLVGRSRKCGIFGGGSSMSGYTDEARGGVFAAFDAGAPSSYEEFVADSPYGWLDTALVSAMLFSGIYMVLYLINSVWRQFPMYDIDKPRLSAEFLIVFYFVIWFIVRTVKVAFAENGNTFQPQLDLFNRSRGVLGFDIAVIIIGLLCWFDIDFIPVVRALVIGVILNLFCRKNREIWPVINPFHRRTGELEDSDTTAEKLDPPTGNDIKEYKWDLDPFDSEKPVAASCTLHFDLAYIEKLRTDNPFYMEMPIREYSKYVEKMRDYLTSNDTATYHTRYLAQEIKAIAERNKLTELDTAQFVLDFVQKPNINYVIDKDSASIAKPCEYMRYPDETLYDKEGDCDCKAFLAYMLYHAMGFDVLFMLSAEYEHAAIGVALKDPRWKDVVMKSLNIPEDKYLDFVCEIDGREYLYCETTNDHFKVGQVPQGESITKFDKKIELLIDDEE